MERPPAGSQARARQHEDVLMVDGRHGFPFGLKARLRERCGTPAKLRRCGKQAFPA
jgi:hypothetical protein